MPENSICFLCCYKFIIFFSGFTEGLNNANKYSFSGAGTGDFDALVNFLVGRCNNTANLELIENQLLVVDNTHDIIEQIVQMDSDDDNRPPTPMPGHSSIDPELQTLPLDNEKCVKNGKMTADKHRNGPSVKVNVENDIIILDSDSGELYTFQSNYSRVVKISID